MEDIEYIVTTPGEADTAPEGARKINANFDRLVAALPTKVSDLTNDLAYLSLTGALQYFYLKNQTYTREEINQKIAAIKTASFEVVDALPASGEGNIIYLVPKDGEKPDTHDEYIWVDGAWELIGSTQIDLSNYLQKTGDASDTTVTFVSEAGEPTSGSSLSSLVGRIVKKISDIVSGAIAVAKATKATQDADGNKISETYLKRSGGTMTGNLVQKKGNCSIHTDVASYRIPSQHTGWIALDCGINNAISIVGHITLYRYYTGALSIQVSGYTYAEGIALTRDNWITPRYGIYGSWYGDMPQVAFVKDGTTGRRYIIIGGDDFAWNAYDYVSLDKVVLGSLGNTTAALPFTWSALSGTVASLGLVAATSGDMSEGVEVQRARQDKDGNDIPSTYATKAEVSSLSIGGVNYITGLKDNWEAGYINQTNGSVTTPDNYNVVTKDYQDISPLAGKRATISASDTPIEVTGTTYYFSLRYAFYDIDKTFLSGGATGNNTPSIVSINVPATAAYVKVSAGVGKYAHAFNNFESIRLKLELGDYATDYSLAPQDIPTVNDLPDVYVDTVPTSPKDGDILITTTD